MVVKAAEQSIPLSRPLNGLNRCCGCLRLLSSVSPVEAVEVVEAVVVVRATIEAA